MRTSKATNVIENYKIIQKFRRGLSVYCPLGAYGHVGRGRLLQSTQSVISSSLNYTFKLFSVSVAVSLLQIQALMSVDCCAVLRSQ